MKRYLENESCEAVRAYLTVYPVRVAAALWCGIAPSDIDEELQIARETLPGIYSHSYIPCLEPRCRAIHDAILAGALPVSRENGRVTREHIAPARRHVSREHLKQWITTSFPADRPDFLFDELERQARPFINAESFLALQADLKATRLEIEARNREIELAAAWGNATEQELDKVRKERDSLQATVDRASPPGDRAETTYLNIIGGLLGLMLGTTPAGKARSVYTSQANVIEAMLAYYGSKDGISKKTLEAKFANANRSIEQ